MRELVAGMMEKQGTFFKENEDLKRRVTACESPVKENKEMNKEMEVLNKENENIKTKCKE